MSGKYDNINMTDMMLDTEMKGSELLRIFAKNDGLQTSSAQHERIMNFLMINIWCRQNNEVTTVSPDIPQWRGVVPCHINMIYLSSGDCVCCEGEACSGKCSQLLSPRQNIRQQRIKWNLTVIIKLTAESSRKKLVGLASRSVSSCGKIEVSDPSNIV